MSKIHDDLAVEWAEIDGEGLIRVIKTDSFRSGFALTAEIGKTSEQTGYYPEVLLTNSKITITIPFDEDGLAHKLAHEIDTILGNVPEA